MPFKVTLIFITIAMMVGAAPSSSERYVFNLREAEGATACLYNIEMNIDENRSPRVIETALCLGVGHSCHLSQAKVSACMQLMADVEVTYRNSGRTKNESFPVGCGCVNRPAKRAFQFAINTVD